MSFHNYIQGRSWVEILKGMNNVFSVMDAQVDNVFLSAENTLNVFSGEIEKNLDNQESLTRTLRNVISLNPEIISCMLVFIPDSSTAESYCSLMARREGEEVHNFVLTEDPHSHLAHDWYNMPLRTGENTWSNLHINKEDSTQTYISLSKPIKDKRDEFCAVFMVKISLKWVVRMINERTPFPHFANVLTNEEDIAIVYQVDNDSTSGRQVLVTPMRDEQEARFLDWHVSPCEMLMKAHNVSFVKRDGEIFYMFTLSMPFGGWVMNVVCPGEDLFGGLWQTTVATGVIGFLGLLLLFFFSRRTINRMTRPLNDLSASAREIAQGNFFSPLPEIKTGDEMQELGESFRVMQSSLGHYMEELKRTTIAKQRIESELAIAHVIQMDMIPKTFPPFPDRQDIDIYAMMRPAREVGGDLYDYFIKEEKLYFIIGDVSGKGVPASLLMAVTRCLFRSTAYQADSPSEIVRRMNQSVTDMNDQGMFVTLFVGILDLHTGDLRFCDAGHNPFVVITDSDSSFMKMNPNLPVAVMGDFPYKTEHIHLGGTTLLFYTDGLTEAENERQEFYGDDRLLQVTSRLGGKSPTEVTHEITHSVEAFVGQAEQSDDLTVLTIRYLVSL